MTLPPFLPLSDDQAELLRLHPLPLLVLDAQQRVRYVNAAALALSTDPTDTPVGDVVWERYPSLVDSGFHREYARVFRDGTATNFEEYRPENDRWFAVTAYPAEGGLVASLRDITEEKRWRDERSRAEQTLLLAQQTARIGSFSYDVRLGRIEWSDQVYRMLGLVPGEFDPNLTHATPEQSLVHPEDHAIVRGAWKRSLLSGAPQTVRHRVIRPGGAILVCSSSFVARLDQHGEAEELIGTVRDITDDVAAEQSRVALDARLREAHKLESLGVLAGGIAHDFNNLLVGILGNASLALLDLPSSAPVRASVEEIEQAAQRAAELTRQLLAYAGKGRFVFEMMNCSQVVRELTVLLRSAASPHANIRLALAENLPLVEADLTQFQQAVTNLVTNASDALAERVGEIEIRTGVLELDGKALARCVAGSETMPGRHVYVQVRDNGRGMDEITMARIFDPFFTTKFTGRGLGLAATLGIMRGHRGAIQVESVTGAGTTITLYFPSALPTRHTPIASARTIWAATGDVLVVDDEPSVRTVCSALLRRRGLTVVEATSGSDALSLLAENPDGYRLVLLDLSMPEMDGDQTFRTLREVSPAVPVILMSGHDEQEVTRQFAGRGLSGFLAKPFRVDDLDALVRRIVHPEG